ncbi:MAG: hypothetical protein ABJI22_04570, partial [Maribacter sp.]
ITIPFVYFIRIKLYDKHVHGIDLEAMEAELVELKNKGYDNKVDFDSKSQNKDSHKDEISTISEDIETKLSTGNLEKIFKHIQDRIQSLFHMKSKSSS